MCRKRISLDRREIIGLERKQLLNKGQPVDLVLAPFRQCGEKDQLTKRLHVGKHHTCQECCCNWSCSGGDRQKLSTIQQKCLGCSCCAASLSKFSKTSLCGNFLHTQIKTIVGGFMAMVTPRLGFTHTCNFFQQSYLLDKL